MPGTWALLRDRLRPRAQRRYRLPSLAAYLMNVTILYSMSRQRAARRLTDLYFNPPLDRVGMLQWRRFDQIVQQGHAARRRGAGRASGRGCGLTRFAVGSRKPTTVAGALLPLARPSAFTGYEAQPPARHSA